MLGIVTECARGVATADEEEDDEDDDEDAVDGLVEHFEYLGRWEVVGNRGGISKLKIVIYIVGKK